MLDDLQNFPTLLIS